MTSSRSQETFSRLIFSLTCFWVIAATVAERWSQRWRTRFIVQCCSSVVDRWIDGNSPHGSSVSIAVAIIVRSSIATGPNVEWAWRDENWTFNQGMVTITYQDHDDPEDGGKKQRNIYELTQAFWRRIFLYLINALDNRFHRRMTWPIDRFSIIDGSWTMIDRVEENQKQSIYRPHDAE